MSQIFREQSEQELQQEDYANAQIVMQSLASYVSENKPDYALYLVNEAERLIQKAKRSGCDTQKLETEWRRLAPLALEKEEKNEISIRYTEKDRSKVRKKLEQLF